MEPEGSKKPGVIAVARFWAPLEATWLMMAIEGPVVAAVIARLASPKLNLAAYGVALAIAMLVEAPIIMVMSAATALAADREAYRKLRNFTLGLNLAITTLMIGVLIPPVFRQLARVLGLPPEVASLTWTAVAIFVPWPAAIGYRRLYQGVLIRAGMPGRVAYGTVLRLSVMAATGLGLGAWGKVDGAAVGAAALTLGVVAEAVGSRVMVRRALARLLQQARPPGAVPIGYRDIAVFYYPLALTSLLNMGVQPVVTFFLARGSLPLASLAVLPVVNSLVFVFRTFGLAAQETILAWLAGGPEHQGTLRRFSRALAVVSSAGLAAIGWTPLAGVWFERIAGLVPSLAALAVTPSRILAIMPAMTVWMAWQRALLVHHRLTRPVTLATAAEVGGVIAVMLIGNRAGVVGIVSAAWALVIGRLLGNLVLVRATG